jgi:hypothetical protein
VPTLSPSLSKYPVIDGVEYREGREICQQGTAAGDRAYKYRLSVMCDRQYGLCAICGLWMSDPTFDHESGRGHGGGMRNDAIVDAEGNWVNAAVDLRCNVQKSSKRYHWKEGFYVPIDLS